MIWVFKQDLKPSSVKFVLLALADHAGASGEAWPCIKSLSDKTSQDRKTVIAAITKLENLGYIIDTGKRSGATGQVKVYRLFGWNEECSTEEYQKRNRSENGAKQSRFSLETVPKTGHGTQREPKGNHQSPQAPKGVVGGSNKIDRRVPTTEHALRIAKVFKRRAETPWDEKEIKAYQKLCPMSHEDLALVEEYYQENRDKPDNICRTALYTFLNNYQGEVDRARQWKSKTQNAHKPNSPSSAANNNLNAGAVSEY